MGWIQDLLKAKTKDWVFGYLRPENTPGNKPHLAVTPNEAYITVWLKSARIVYSRIVFSKFFGTVHCHTSLPIRGQTDPAQFHHVTTPTKLRDADPKHLDRVVDVNHEVLGPIPYTGGSLAIESALFSIKSANLVQPYLEVMDTLSSLAGVSYVQIAKPFIAPIQKGIDLLFSGGDDQRLEIGLSRSFNPIETGYFVIIGASKEEIIFDDIRVVGDDFRLEVKGRDITDFPYLVFEITASPKRPDYLNIPEIKDAYESFRIAEREGNVKEAEAAFGVFRRIALTSYDLLFNHALELVQVAEKEMRVVLGPATQSQFAEAPHARELGELPVSFR